MNNSIELLIKKLLVVINNISARIDFFQGAGGNVSVKLDNEIMAIKSSGIEIKEMNQHHGYSLVNFKKIHDHFLKLPKNINKKIDESTVSFINDQLIDLPHYKSLRPSIETGFHSILKKYVIHSHSVYANILTCCDEFEHLVDAIFKKDNFINIKYFPPGTSLTKNILIDYNLYFKNFNKYPEIIFLKNHGLIIHSDDNLRCKSLHSYVNESIVNFFGINQISYPEINLTKVNDSYFKSSNNYLINFFKTNNNISPEYFNQTLFPDQTVYFKNNITFNLLENKKVKISPDKIEYYTNEKEANTIEETLIAYIFVRNFIEENNYKCSFFPEKEMDYIHDLESEKYRKKMLKK